MTGRSVVITGGSRGIGAEVARRLAVAGDRVVVGCRQKQVRARRLSDRAVAEGAQEIDVRVGDLREPRARRHLLSGLGRIDVLVLAASGGMEDGSTERDAFALNRDAQVDLVRRALPLMRAGGVVVYLTSHQAHFSREVAPEPEYETVAASKRAGEDALLSLGDHIASVGARLVIVSADVVVDSATTLLMERLRPGSTAERRRQIGALPTTSDVAQTVIDAIARPHPHGAIVMHGGAEWFLERAAASATRGCPRVRRVEGKSFCASGMVARIRAHLEGRGLGGFDRVLVCDESTPETALVVLALMDAGVSIVLLDPGLPPTDVEQIAARTACAATITARDLSPAGDRVDLGGTGPVVAAVGARSDCGCDGDARTGFTAWEARADGIVLWTSGSSGRPRGVVRSGSSVLENVRATVEAMRYRADDVLLPLLPLSHQYGLSLVLAWWLVGCTLVLGNHRRPVQTLRAASPRGVTVVDATPPVMVDILDLLEERGCAEVAPRVRLWCVGGSPLRPSLAERFRRVTGLPLLDGYGSTELGNVSLATLERPEGLGRVLPGVDLSVRRSDGAPAEPGETGELWIRSAAVFTATIGEDRPAEIEDGWYRTGDIGSVDAHGVLRVIGRAGAVHRGGHTVYPSHIEDRADSAGIPLTVVALADERRGAHLTAFIEDVGTHTRAEWIERVRDALPAHEWPNRVVLVAELPRLGTGKVDRARLAAEAEAGRAAARKDTVADVSS